MTNVLLGVTGSIAAYKIIELSRLLKKSKYNVKVILTKDAAKFVTATSFRALGCEVYTDDSEDNSTSIMQHIALAKWPDLIVVAPLSANTLGKIAHGLGDNLLTATILASNVPVYLVPAMNMYMWENAIVQENINKLKIHNFTLWGPAVGIQACGDDGEGRMIEAREIESLITHAIFAKKQDCKKLKVLLTLGSTIEPIDPVRYISNHSSGKMGMALAYALYSRGAEVSLVVGKVSVLIPEVLSKNVTRINTVSEMLDAVVKQAKGVDLFIACAAVSDYSPNTIQEQKIKKTKKGDLNLSLSKTTDIVTLVKEQNPELFVVGFAAETNNLIEHAKTKLKAKNLNMIIANDVSDGKVFGCDENEVTIINYDSNYGINTTTIPSASKNIIAHAIISKLLLLIG